MQKNLEGLARAFGASFEALLDGLSEAVVAFGYPGAGERFYRCGAGANGRAEWRNCIRGKDVLRLMSGMAGWGEDWVLGLVVFWAFIGKRGPIAMLHVCENE